jgi:hypothetical protein
MSRSLEHPLRGAAVCSLLLVAPYLDFHSERMDGRAKEAAATTGIFKSVTDLSLAVENFELRLGFAAHEFLKATPTSLTHRNHLRVRDVRLQGIGTAVHLFSTHDIMNLATTSRKEGTDSIGRMQQNLRL